MVAYFRELRGQPRQLVAEGASSATPRPREKGDVYCASMPAGVVEQQATDALHYRVLRKAVAQGFADSFALTTTPRELADALEDSWRTKAMLDTPFHKLIQEGREECRNHFREEAPRSGVPAG